MQSLATQFTEPSTCPQASTTAHAQHDKRRLADADIAFKQDMAAREVVAVFKSRITRSWPMTAFAHPLL